MRHRAIAFAACLLAGIVTSPVKSAPLGLTLQDSPQASSGFINVSYSASTDEFLASGFALSLFDQGFWIPIIPDAIDSFTISATIDEFGTAGAGGLSITGSILGLGPTLLTGTLTDFGFLDGGGDLFEFLFTVDDGVLGIPGLFGGPGSVFGVVLDANGSNFTGDFGTDFSNTFRRGNKGPGVALTAPIPEPTTLALLLTGALVWRNRRRA